MARSLNATTQGAAQASPSDVQSIASLIAGEVPKASASVKRGKEALDAPRACNIGVFGDQGTGKTKMLVDLLLEGLKVYGINTDFGGCGFDTVYNYFTEHSDKAYLINNFTEVKLDYRGILQFMRDPVVIDPEIYDFDPDILAWDGFSAFQQADLEEYVGDLDPVRSEKKKSDVAVYRDEGLFLEQADWGMIKNGTLKPLHGFFRLNNIKNRRPWSKLITFLEEKKDDWVNNERVPNSGKAGPLLHGASRKIVGAGCSIMLQTKKLDLGQDVTYTYVSRGADLMIKDRSYGLPESMPADAGLLWREYIAPRIKWFPRTEKESK